MRLFYILLYVPSLILAELLLFGRGDLAVLCTFLFGRALYSWYCARLPLFGVPVLICLAILYTNFPAVLAVVMMIDD